MSPSPKQASPRQSSAASGAKRQWVAVELTTAGEQELDISMVEKAVRKLLQSPDLSVFVPALSTNVRSDSQTLVYMDGYVFVEFRAGINYLRLRETMYFNDVLCTRSKGSGPAYALIEDGNLDPMRKGMESVKENRFATDDRVKVTTGSFKGLRCIVVDTDGEIVNVRMDYRSKPMILAYKSTYLEKIPDGQDK